MNSKQVSVGFTVVQAAQVAGVGRSTLYQALAAGKLRARKLGRRTLILEHELRAWLEELPPYQADASTAGGQ